jgi:Arc/MetJ-type ribon-helix-helix transcriptional regulator
MAQDTKLHDKRRYELASIKVLEKMVSWKRCAVIEDRASGNLNSRVMDEFSKAVVAMAEDDKEIFTTTE